MIGCLRTRVRKQQIIVLYFEFETALKFYNLETWCVTNWAHRGYFRTLKYQTGLLQLFTTASPGNTRVKVLNTMGDNPIHNSKYTQQMLCMHQRSQGMDQILIPFAYKHILCHLHGWKFKISKILNFWNSNLKTCRMATKIDNLNLKWLIVFR